MAKKPNVFSRAASVFVQREPVEEPTPHLSDEEYAALAAQEPSAPIVEVDSSQINSADVIRSIYQQGDFREENSLFRLDGFISSLPKEMPTETKQGSIASILRYSGIDIDALVDDGERRLALLLASQSQLKEDNSQREAQANKEIEELKLAIQEAERRISEDRHTTEQSCGAIEVESTQLRALLEFARGVSKISAGG